MASCKQESAARTKRQKCQPEGDSNLGSFEIGPFQKRFMTLPCSKHQSIQTQNVSGPNSIEDPKGSLHVGSLEAHITMPPKQAAPNLLCPEADKASGPSRKLARAKHGSIRYQPPAVLPSHPRNSKRLCGLQPELKSC